ncbi:hypothetical protein BGZ54_009146, partial [Gamsiella multidivaricata]
VDAARVYLNQIPRQAIPYNPPPKDFPPDQWGNRIPDFSQVGYRSGHVPLPQVPVKIILHPSSDPQVNDRARIQNAIDWVGRQPLQSFTLRDRKTVIRTRGAVLLQAGIYHIQGALILNKSGVVLRGEGNGPNGTVLMASGQFRHDFIHINAVLDPTFQGTPEYLVKHGASKEMSPKDPYVILDQQVARVAKKYVPVGTTKLPVQDVSNFKIGTDVVLERRAKASWVHLLGMDDIPQRPGDPGRTRNWDPRQYTLRYVRKVMAIEKKPQAKLRVKRNQHRGRRVRWSRHHRHVIDRNHTSIIRMLETKSVVKGEGDHEDDDIKEENGYKDLGTEQRAQPGYLRLDIPTVMNMDPAYGRSVVYNFERETPIPSDVGVENMALWSEYDPDNLLDEQHAWFAVLVDHCEHCWVADIKARNFVSGVKAGPGSKHVTIQDSEMLEPISLRNAGGRRYMYMLQGHMGLVKRCFASDSRHDFLTGSKTPGPNVFVDSDGIRANNDAGPHDRWTTGTLYDNIHSHDLNVRNRGWMGSGQGWSGAFHVVYRCSADVSVEFQSPPGATNWVIHFEGKLGHKSVEFKGDNATFLDPNPKNGKVSRSLYWSQLVARMGNTNDAAITVENYVGVAGKNSYPPPMQGRFVSMEEIVARDKQIRADLAGDQGSERWEADDITLKDLVQEIQRLERDQLSMVACCHEAI